MCEFLKVIISHRPWSYQSLAHGCHWCQWPHSAPVTNLSKHSRPSSPSQFIFYMHNITVVEKFTLDSTVFITEARAFKHTTFLLSLVWRHQRVPQIQIPYWPICVHSPQCLLCHYSFGSQVVQNWPRIACCSKHVHIAVPFWAPDGY